MKNIILATAVSALFATTAIAGTTSGTIDFEGTVVNPSCAVSLNGVGGQNFVVNVGEVDRAKFGSGATAGKILSTARAFDIEAKGYDCDKAKLTLATGANTVDNSGVNAGVFIGENATATSTLAFQLINNSLEVAASTPANFDNTTPEAISVKTPAPAGEPWNAVAKYDYTAYLFNNGAIPEAGVYTAQLVYTITN